MMYKIMIVEDDPKLAGLLESQIARYGNEGIIIREFDHVLERFREIKPHLVLLDVNLPSYDGYFWCRQIRSMSTCPIIFISARNGTPDQLRALENGADDYITKPFAYDIVIAKIHSQLRRVYGDYAPGSGERTVEKEGLVLYPERMELQLNEQTTPLTKKETILLETLLARSPRLVTRETILEKLWDDTFVDDNTLSVNINRVRKRLMELGIEGALETVRGSGYRLHPVWQRPQ